MNKKICALVVLAGAALLSGCNEEADALLKSPQVEDVGTFDGCEVKFVNRGYDVKSFYMAKCPGQSVTTTADWKQSQGKSTVFRSRVVIEQDIAKLEAEKADAEAKEKALEKLSPEEKKALGL